jgi:HK97 family phage prohead protease
MGVVRGWPAPHSLNSGGSRVQHQRLDFNFKIKSTSDESGTFVGMAAIYGNVDLGSDVIEKGAFTRTLSAGKDFPILWQHQTDNPIGLAKITDTPQGLQINGTLLLADPVAQRAYALIKAGVIKGLSIGYETIQSMYDSETEVRHLTEIKLWEVSCVTFPMNESAQISSVKAMSDDDRARHLKALDMHRKTIDRAQRGMRESLKALFGDDLFDDDPADDPALVEDDEGEEEMSKAFLVELQKFATQARELAK